MCSSLCLLLHNIKIKKNIEVCGYNIKILAMLSTLKVIIICFCSSRHTFLPDWNNNHSHSCRPRVGGTHLRSNHVCCACPISQDGGPPASARGSVPALRRRQRPICSLRSQPQHVSFLLFFPTTKQCCSVLHKKGNLAVGMPNPLKS